MKWRQTDDEPAQKMMKLLLTPSVQHHHHHFTNMSFFLSEVSGVNEDKPAVESHRVTETKPSNQEPDSDTTNTGVKGLLSMV